MKLCERKMAKHAVVYIFLTLTLGFAGLYSCCGNGVVNMMEQCDDGNANNNDDCVKCKVATCGDGFINSQGGENLKEVCDPSATEMHYICSQNCKTIEGCLTGWGNCDGDFYSNGCEQIANGMEGAPCGENCAACNPTTQQCQLKDKKYTCWP